MIFVDEAGRDKAVVLVIGFDLVRVHHQLAEKIWFVESIKANGYSNADEDNGNAHGVEFKGSAMLKICFKI